MTDENGSLIDEAESLATDVYLDGVLARRGGARPTALPATVELSISIRATADLLDRSLPRFHPSFRFEERLAGRLRDTAEGRGSAPGPGRLVAFPGMGTVFDEDHGAGDRRGHGMLVGGAIASGLSIAGAALLAWRRARGPDVASGAIGKREL